MTGSSKIRYQISFFVHNDITERLREHTIEHLYDVDLRYSSTAMRPGNEEDMMRLFWNKLQSELKCLESVFGVCCQTQNESEMIANDSAQDVCRGTKDMDVYRSAMMNDNIIITIVKMKII